MKVSLSWLKEYVPVEMEVSKLADALTMVGLEVDSISERYDYLDTVVVGRIVEIQPHPNADKLRMCKVDIGDRFISVACGAPNIETGMLAPAALPGTILPNGLKLETTVIRGEKSEGMLCSDGELGIGPDYSGVRVLDADLAVGQKLAVALKLSDPVFDISLTPNRSDCLSIIGIAREVAAIQKKKIRYPSIHRDGTSQARGDFDLEKEGEKTRIKISENEPVIFDISSVKIESPELCPRYTAKILEDITIRPSPFWLQDRLMSVGLRPISNIVDVTNFVMMEMGQPLHAFDLDQLAEQRIVVRTAEEGEVFVTLDEKERKLSGDMLLICDGEKAVGLAGVMGGMNSEISDATTRVLLESACFNPASIRKTSKKLGLPTDASHRFERGVDPHGTVKALERAANLMAEVGGGRLVEGVIDEHPLPQVTEKIPVSVEKTNRLLGSNLTANEIAEILERIEFTVEPEDEDRLMVVPPSYRVDVFRAVDVMEEVARLWGYKNIRTTYPAISASEQKPPKQRRVRDRVRNTMTGLGYTESVNYSFSDRASCDKLLLDSEDERRRMLGILNPLIEDHAVMRTSMLPGLLLNMRLNIAQQVKNLKMFEVGKVFISKGQDELPDEIEMLAGILTGNRYVPYWHAKEKEIQCDFYDAKGAVESLFDALNIDNAVFTAETETPCTYTKVGRTAYIYVDSTWVGVVGEFDAKVLSSYDIKSRAFMFEINMDRLKNLIPDVVMYRSIPKYPAISRDMTLIVRKDIESIRLLEAVKDMNEALIEDIYFFDVYDGEPVGPINKSISFRITYRSAVETLEDEYVDKIHKNIADALLKRFDASLPA